MFNRLIKGATMRAVLWILTIVMAALGGAILIENLDISSYNPGRPVALFMALVFLLTAVAIYVRKLHHPEAR